MGPEALSLFPCLTYKNTFPASRAFSIRPSAVHPPICPNVTGQHPLQHCAPQPRLSPGDRLRGLALHPYALTPSTISLPAPHLEGDIFLSAGSQSYFYSSPNVDPYRDLPTLLGFRLLEIKLGKKLSFKPHLLLSLSQCSL